MLVNNWLDMKINQFYEYNKVISKYKNDNIDLNLNIYSLFSGIDVYELENMPYYKLQSMLKKINWVNSSIPKIRAGEVVVKNILFKPKLISDITTSEYLDFIEYSKEDNNIHLILSLFLKPVKKVRKGLVIRYEELDYTREEVQEILLEDMSIVYANSFIVFFSTILNRLIMYLTQILRTKMTHKKIKMRIQRLLRQEVDGAGLSALTELLKQLEELGMKYIN